MCDDVPAFTDASVTLVIGIVRKFFMMVGFSGARMLLPGVAQFPAMPAPCFGLQGGHLLNIHMIMRMPYSDMLPS